MHQVFAIPYFSVWFAGLHDTARIAAAAIPILIILFLTLVLPQFDQTNREDEIGS